MADTQPTAAKPADDNASAEKPSNLYYVDLVLGSWRPREAACQMAASLGVDLASFQNDDADEAGLALGAEAVDIGAAGDPLIRRSWHDACRIAASLPDGAATIVFAPQFELPLRADNEWFFYFLSRLGQVIVVVGTEPEMLAVDTSPFKRRPNIALPEWRPLSDGIGAEQMHLIRLFPGLLPRRVAEAADLGRAIHSLVAIGTEHFLVPTIHRDADPRACAFDFDALEAFEAFDDGFKAIAQTYCTSHFADVTALVDLGLRRFRAGSRDLGRDLVTRARAVARDPASIARTEALLLEMALVERRYTEVIAAQPLSPRAPAPEREKLRYLKHCARLAIGDLSGAPDFVAESLRRLRDASRADAADVVRLNGVVRARQAAGDSDGAVTLGRSVGAALAHAAKPVDQRLIYANAMSLVGVYAARGEHAAVSAEVGRAFAPSLGARSPSDVLLINFLRARTESDQTTHAAAAYWLRTALAWLCLDPREAFGRDAIVTIVGADTGTYGRIDSAISEALGNALAESWPEIASTPPGRAPEVQPVSAMAKKPPRQMYAGSGAAVLWTPDTMTAPPTPPPRARLCRLVHAALGKICPPFAKTSGGTISADTNLGVDIPATREEALSSALRVGVVDFCFGDERLRLDGGTRTSLLPDLEVQLSPIVNEVADSDDGVVVSFKRYLPTKVLDEEETRMIAPLRSGDRLRLRTMQMVADGQPLAEAEAKLRKLEAEHIVRLDVKPL